MVVVVLVLVDRSVVVPGDALAVVVLVLLLELEPPPVAGDGFTIVVLFSVFVPGEAAGVTVSVRCSHAARSAAPAMMQIYFFMVVGRPCGHWLIRNNPAERPCLHRCYGECG